MTVDSLIAIATETAVWVLLLSVVINAVPPLARRFNSRSTAAQQSIVVFVAVVASLLTWSFDCIWNAFGDVVCAAYTTQRAVVVIGVAYVLATSFNIGSGDLLQAIGEFIAAKLRKTFVDKGE